MNYQLKIFAVAIKITPIKAPESENKIVSLKNQTYKNCFGDRNKFRNNSYTFIWSGSRKSFLIVAGTFLMFLLVFFSIIKNPLGMKFLMSDEMKWKKS